MFNRKSFIFNFFLKYSKVESYSIRPIQKSDELEVAQLIRTTMQSFDCEGEGFSIQDPEVDHMYDAYTVPRAAFFVIIDEKGRIQGCGGLAQLVGADQNICELKKMYFYPSLRGKGFGKRLVNVLIEKAKEFKYDKMYLETVARMKRANHLYQKLGFQKLSACEGATGHSGCDSFYSKDLT